MGKRKEEDFEKGFKKSRSVGKAVIIFIFILGFVLGLLFSTYLLYPEMNSQLLQEKTNVETKNSLLEQQVTSYLQCLQNNSIDIRTCSGS